MFCPKCGSQNAENIKFCRSCGTELEAVSAALTGRIKLPSERKGMRKDHYSSNDPDALWNTFIKNALIGMAFIIIAIVLTATNVAGGRVWGFWMLIPGAACLGTGIASYYKAKRIERRQIEREQAFATHSLPQTPQTNAALPPRQTLFANDYAPPARNTGELLTPPASVTETTTRHLNINTEGETINLPNQK